jgi:hypothetical protein
MERQREVAKAILCGAVLALLPLLGAKQFQIGQRNFAPISSGGNLVGVVGGPLGTNGGTTSAMNMTGADLCVAAVSYFQPGAGIAVSSSPSNTWIPTTAAAISGNMGVQLFYAIAPTVNSAMTLTTTGAGTYTSGYLACWKNMPGATLDQQSQGVNTGTGTVQPGSVTTTAADLVITAAASYSTSIMTVGSPYTSVAANVYGSVVGLGLGSYTQPSAGATNPTWTTSGTGSVATAVGFTP